MDETKRILIDNLSVPFHFEEKISNSTVFDIRIQRFTPIIFRIEKYELYFDCDMSHYRITYNQSGMDGKSTQTLMGANLFTGSSIDYYIPGEVDCWSSKQYYDMWNDGIRDLTVLMPTDNTIIIKFFFTEHQHDNLGCYGFSRLICQVSLEFIDSTKY